MLKQVGRTPFAGTLSFRIRKYTPTGTFCVFMCDVARQGYVRLSATCPFPREDELARERQLDLIIRTTVLAEDGGRPCARVLLDSGSVEGNQGMVVNVVRVGGRKCGLGR